MLKKVQSRIKKLNEFKQDEYKIPTPRDMAIELQNTKEKKKTIQPLRKASSMDRQ
jgi:hypothetical protein